MIRYRHRSIRDPHPDLAGWAPVPDSLAAWGWQIVEGWEVQALHHHIVDDLTAPGDWQQIDGGWEVCGTPRPLDLQRAKPAGGLRLVLPATSADGVEWLAPVVLRASGVRAFSVPVGPDWLPSPSPEQSHLLALATAAREAQGSGTFDDRAMAQWAAELLSAVFHLSPRTIQALRILDDELIAGILLVSSGLHPGLAAA